jgi:hypothetical protein
MNISAYIAYKFYFSASSSLKTPKSGVKVMKTFWLVKLPVYLLGTLEVTVLREWALHNQVPLSATLAHAA